MSMKIEEPQTFKSSNFSSPINHYFYYKFENEKIELEREAETDMSKVQVWLTFVWYAKE